MAPLRSCLPLAVAALTSAGSAAQSIQSVRADLVADQQGEGHIAGRADEHPLRPLLAMAVEGRERIARDIRDYTCRVIRRERRDGQMRRYEAISAKVRHAWPATGEDSARPFSVYLHFDRPGSLAGREVLFVEGRNSGRMLVRRGGRRLAYLTTFLAVDSPIALRESRYPVTDLGFERLLARLIEVIHEDLQHGECEVQFFEGAKVADRQCTRVLVEHPVRRDHFRYHRAIVFIDKEWQLPLGYASYTWPEQPGGKPVLMEEYIYTAVELNVGLTDADFDRHNPAYGFVRPEELAARD